MRPSRHQRLAPCLWLAVLLLAACARADPDPSTLVAAPTSTTEPDVARRQAGATQTTEERKANAAATSTSVVRDRLATLETRYAAATATMAIESIPPFGLIGRRAA